MDSTITQVGLPSELTRRYDELARQTGQSREDVLRIALEAYLAQIGEEDARLATAIAQADRGEVVDAEQVHAENESFLRQRGVTPEQLAALRAEVFAEMGEA